MLFCTMSAAYPMVRNNYCIAYIVFPFLFVVFIDTWDAKNTATTLAVATALAPVSASARFIADEHCHRSGDSKLLF